MAVRTDPEPLGVHRGRGPAGAEPVPHPAARPPATRPQGRGRVPRAVPAQHPGRAPSVLPPRPVRGSHLRLRERAALPRPFSTGRERAGGGGPTATRPLCLDVARVPAQGAGVTALPGPEREELTAPTAPV